MKKFNYFSLIITLFCFLLSPNNVFAGVKSENRSVGKKPSLQKTTADPQQSLMNINNVTMWVTAEGFHDWVVASGWNGAFPNGSSVGAIFAEGVVWGAQVDDGDPQVVRVNGNTYGSGCAPITRLFRVRPDYLTGDLASDAASFNNIPIGAVSAADIKALRDQYAKDWLEWPAKGNPNSAYGDQGAPFEDKDGDGKYNPDIDVPGIPGASQSLFIKYNDSRSQSNYGALPIGFDVSEVYWAYAYSGALGNVIYKQMTLIYKGTANSKPTSKLDSMFIVQWADPDVGTSSDDYAGCDTVLNLGYAYTAGATDANYGGLGLPSPAVGYDFFSGVSRYTGNAADSAVVNLKWTKGYKYVNEKAMSSFIYFAAGGAWSDPPFSYTGSLQFYNLMRGSRPTPPYPTFSPFPTNVATVTPDGRTYLLSGDPTKPASPTNQIDGQVEGKGDRRIMCVNGPITMNLGDTAQIVLGIVYGQSTVDNLGSVAALKVNDNTAQIVFDRLFKLPSLSPPVVSVAALSKQVVLSWGTNATSVSKIENFADQGYTFQGYEVYQVPSSSSSLADGILLGTWDLNDGITAIYDDIPDANNKLISTLVANGTDKGLSRYLAVTQDQIQKSAIRNGQEYYFAVVAYAYNPNPLLPFHVLRSPFVIQRVVPQDTKPGDRLSSNVGDSLKVTHNGHSDGNVIALVVDPTATTGHDYRVNFAASGNWSLTDVTTNTVKLTNQDNQSGNDAYMIVDGVITKVIGPAVDINTWTFTPSADRWFTGNNAGGVQFFGGLLLGSDFFGSNITPDKYVKVEIRFVTNRSDGQYAYRYLRGGAPNYGFAGYTQQYFTVWNVDANPPVQLAAAFVEQNGNASADSTWHPTASSADREYLFIFNSPYTAAPDAYFTSRNALSQADEFPTMYALWPLQRGTMPFNPKDGQVFTIIPNYANTSADNFTFKAPAAKSSSADLAKKDVEKINVFPNPYYGYQNRELAPNNKYVTFSHLPDNAVIRIFDLSGVLVKTINHDPVSGQFDTWNLANDSNYPVSSGIYIVHIDMPKLGTTKVLKLAVIQEQQMLKTY